MTIKHLSILAAAAITSSALAASNAEAKCGAGSCSKKEISRPAEAACSKKGVGTKEAACSKKGVGTKEAACSKKGTSSKAKSNH